MDNSRMSTADMLQYCEEALAWEDFGPIDIFFFESVKKILLGQCSAIEENEDVIDDLMGIERPVRDVELEPEYGKYADIYYGEEGDDDIPDYSRSKEDEAFDSVLSGEGFFDQVSADESAAARPAAQTSGAPADGGYTLSDSSESVSFASGQSAPESTQSAAPEAASDAPAEYTAVSEDTFTLSDASSDGGYTLSESSETVSVPAAKPAPAPSAPPSVNITVGSENGNLMESEFNDLKESLAAAAAAVEKSMNDK